MRNLKRALSLALASVMVIGMMVIGAGAVGYNDFTDKDEIKNVDAVSMVTELGIINGLPGGTFGPTQNIDRASFVKMVCLAYNGGREPILPANAKSSYKDTMGNWAASYIEYCTNLGFVAGDGATGKFNPSAPVTVSQAAKMLMTALGYSALTEHYVGADWQINVDVAANAAGLYDGISGSTSAALTRDNAAQLIYNALSAKMVKYDGVWNPTTNTIKPQLVETGKTMLENKFGAVKVEGVVLSNEFASLTGKTSESAGKTNVALTDTTMGVASGTFKVASTLDMLGKKVTMFVKPGKTDAASKATVLGSLVVSPDNKVVTTTAKKTTDKLDTLLKDSKLTANSKTMYSYNYGEAVANKPVANPAGALYTFIDNNDDGKVDYAIQFVKTFGKVSSYNTKGDGSVSVKLMSNNTTLGSFSSTNAAEDVNGFADVAKDTYVLCYRMGDQTDGDMYIEKAKSVEGTLTSIRGGKAVVDGTTYEQSGLVKFADVDDTKVLGDAVADSIGDAIVLYLDAAGNVALVTDVESTTDYLYVISSGKYDSFKDTLEAKVVLADGTKSTVVIDAESAGAVNDGDKVKVGVYTYTMNSKNVYKLTAVAASKTVEVTTIKKGSATLALGAAANSKTIFVLANSTGGTYSVYTGINNVPSATIAKGEGVAVVDKYGVAKIVFATKSSLSGAAQSIYVLSEKPVVTVDKNNDKVYSYDVIYKGEKTTLTGDNKGLFATTGLWTAEVSSGEIIKVTGSATQAKAATKAGNDIISNSAKVYTYDSKTVFLVVDDMDVTAGSVDSINIDTVNAKNTDNIIIVEDSDNTDIAATVYICK